MIRALMKKIAAWWASATKAASEFQAEPAPPATPAAPVAVARTMRDRDKLTPEEVGFVACGRCPDCGRANLLEGPCGGLSVNVKCGERDCGSRFNIMGPFGVERISDARPNAPARGAATYRE